MCKYFSKIEQQTDYAGFAVPWLAPLSVPNPKPRTACPPAPTSSHAFPVIRATNTELPGLLNFTRTVHPRLQVTLPKASPPHSPDNRCMLQHWTAALIPFVIPLFVVKS